MKENMNTGTMEYLWKKATMGMGSTPNAIDWTIELRISYYAPPYRPAKVDYGPDDSYPAEGGEVSVEHVTVTGIRHGETVIPVTPAHAHYWSNRFDREMLNDDSFRAELHEAVELEKTEEYDDTATWIALPRWRK